MFHLFVIYNSKIWTGILDTDLDSKSNIILRIQIQFLETKFSCSANISSFYVMIYNSKTWIAILNTDLDSKLKLEF